MERIRIVDSHTGGEPTRVVVSSPIHFTGATMAERCREFNQRFDQYRKAIVCEPRGSDIIVGALLTEPVNPNSTAGVIFFNNVGTLGMCGHGLIGVAEVLRYLNEVAEGCHFVDTPVGTVKFETLGDHRVRIENVPSYRWKKKEPIEIFPGTPNQRIVQGDIAWGGNWFFICDDHGQQMEFDNIEQLSKTSVEIRRQLDANQISGRAGQCIDHVELVGPSMNPDRSDAKNFVLCPGAVYDRSPCGTGTSAKIACLAADAKLAPGAVYRQESIVGSVFEASFQNSESADPSLPPSILPTIVGSAFITGEAELLLDSDDPFCWGLSAR